MKADSSTKKVTSTEIKIALSRINTKNYFLTEVKSGSSYMGTANRILDALAIKKSYTNKCFTGYEIKVSRSDFKADNKMYTYLPLVHQLYLVCPKGLIQPEELPLEIGLMWYNPEKQTLVYKKKTPRRNIEIDPEMLLYIIYSRLEEDRIPFYSSKAEFLKDWMENKNSNRDLGNRVGSELARRISSLERQLEDTQKFGTGKEMEHYKEILQACVDAGMPDWYAQGRNTYAADWIRKELKRDYPEILDTVQRQLDVATKAIQRAKEVADEQN